MVHKATSLSFRSFSCIGFFSILPILGFSMTSNPPAQWPIQCPSPETVMQAENGSVIDNTWSVIYNGAKTSTNTAGFGLNMVTIPPGTPGNDHNFATCSYNSSGDGFSPAFAVDLKPVSSPDVEVPYISPNTTNQNWDSNGMFCSAGQDVFPPQNIDPSQCQWTIVQSKN